LEIYQTCRTKEEIDQAFDNLQEEMAVIVASRMEETKEKVINRLDEDVARRLKDKKQESELLLSTMQERLMKLVKIECKDKVKNI
jgi:NCAIR mutase (PurE)-related protein